MKRLVGLALAALALLLVAPASLGQGDHVSDAHASDEAAIRSLIEHTAAANNAGDVERWVSLFAPDAVYMPPGARPVTTRAGLVEIAEAGFRHEASIAIEPAEIQVAGDWAFARNRVTGTVKVAGTGEVVDVDVKQVVIYQRADGGTWRIARLISNANG